MKEPADFVGTTIAGKFRIDQVLGEGGMGFVLGAYDERVEREVALKLPKAEALAHEGFVELFLRDAKCAAKIESPHAVKIHEVGTLDDGTPFIAMERLRGMDLATLLAQLEEMGETLPVGEAVEYALQACVALAEAHALKIVHRDLKPANLFLHRPKVGNAFVKVLDFGIAKAPPSSPSAAQITKGWILGTPGYMSPEQRLGEPVDERTDIWALGIILHEMTTGRRPFEGEQQEPPFSAMGDDISADFVAVVATCLQFDRDMRHTNVARLADALAPFAPANVFEAAHKRIARLRGVSEAIDPRLPEPAGARSPARSLQEARTSIGRARDAGGLAIQKGSQGASVEKALPERHVGNELAITKPDPEAPPGDVRPPTFPSWLKGAGVGGVALSIAIAVWAFRGTVAEILCRHDGRIVVDGICVSKQYADYVACLKQVGLREAADEANATLKGTDGDKNAEIVAAENVTRKYLLEPEIKQRALELCFGTAEALGISTAPATFIAPVKLYGSGGSEDCPLSGLRRLRLLPDGNSFAKELTVDLDHRCAGEVRQVEASLRGKMVRLELEQGDFELVDPERSYALDGKTIEAAVKDVMREVRVVMQVRGGVGCPSGRMVKLTVADTPYAASLDPRDCSARLRLPKRLEGKQAKLELEAGPVPPCVFLPGKSMTVAPTIDAYPVAQDPCICTRTGTGTGCDCAIACPPCGDKTCRR